MTREQMIWEQKKMIMGWLEGKSKEEIADKIIVAMEEAITTTHDHMKNQQSFKLMEIAAQSLFRAPDIK